MVESDMQFGRESDVATSPQSLYIVGHPVSHSKSPVMYNAVYSKLGLPWHYDFMDVGEDGNDRALDFLRGSGYLSVNVTTPCKPAAFDAADAKASTAILTGGVNLMVAKDGHHLGYNVDGQGCVRFLEREGVTFEGSRVVVCGTGPTSLSILHACAQAGAGSITLLGRSKERTRSVLEGYVERYRHLVSTAISLPSPNDGHLGFAEAYENARFSFGAYPTSRKALSEADVVIDATVLGMRAGDPAPFDTSLLSGSQVVMDTVYGHGETALISAAKAVGCRAFDGAGMLVSQAAISATTVCEVSGIDLRADYDELFEIMADAAGFEFESAQ